MMLRVRCECGKVLKLTDRSVGKAIPCPACGAKIRIAPRNDAAIEALEEVEPPVSVTTVDEDLYDFVQDDPKAQLAHAAPVAPVPRPVPANDGPPCPGCKSPLPADARICIHCGIDLSTGRPVNELESRIDGIVGAVSWFVPLGAFPITPTDPSSRSSPFATWLIAAAMVLISATFFVYLHGGADPEPAILNLQLWTGNTPAFKQKTAHLVDLMERRIKQKAREAHPQGLVTADVTRDARRRATTMAASITGVPEGVGFRLPQVLTSAMLHDSSQLFPFLYHLLGNVLFLLVFGLALNEVLGNGKTLLIYVFLVIAAATTDLLLNLRQPLHPFVGASGAISGLAGMYAVCFGAQPVHLATWVRLRTWLDYKTFAIHGVWLVAAWTLYNDVIPAFVEVRSEEAIIPHATHLIVFVAGALLAAGLLATRTINLRGGDLISMLLEKRRRKRPAFQ